MAGQHCNSTKLIGAVTKPSKCDSFALVFEFCQLGDLQNYILQYKSSYVKLIFKTIKCTGLFAFFFLTDFWFAWNSTGTESCSRW